MKKLIHWFVITQFAVMILAVCLKPFTADAHLDHIRAVVFGPGDHQELGRALKKAANDAKKQKKRALIYKKRWQKCLNSKDKTSK